jgi:hypothetical protein
VINWFAHIGLRGKRFKLNERLALCLAFGNKEKSTLRQAQGGYSTTSY